MSPSLGQSSLEPGRWGWGQVGEAGASLLGGACWGTVPRLRPHGWRCQGRGGMGAQLPCSPACVHTLTLSLLAVTLLMDTVGPRGAEEVHRSLGALGGVVFKNDSPRIPSSLGTQPAGTKGPGKGSSGLRGFRDPSSFSCAEESLWRSRMPSLMLSGLVSVLEASLNAHCRSRGCSDPAESQTLRMPLWAPLLAQAAPCSPRNPAPCGSQPSCLPACSRGPTFLACGALVVQCTSALTRAPARGIGLTAPASTNQTDSK